MELERLSEYTVIHIIDLLLMTRMLLVMLLPPSVEAACDAAHLRFDPNFSFPVVFSYDKEIGKLPPDQLFLPSFLINED